MVEEAGLEVVQEEVQMRREGEREEEEEEELGHEREQEVVQEAEEGLRGLNRRQGPRHGADYFRYRRQKKRQLARSLRQAEPSLAEVVQGADDRRAGGWDDGRAGGWVDRRAGGWNGGC